jgi:hypothetical protein
MSRLLQARDIRILEIDRTMNLRGFLTQLGFLHATKSASELGGH